MDSGDSSSDSSDSNKPRPGSGVSDDEEEEEGVYFPPHFPQRKKSGSDFSPHSESSEDDQSLSSTSEDDQLAPPINTYAPPPTYRPQLLDNSDQESGSSMEPRIDAKSQYGVVPYQSVPVRNRPVNYKKFYSGVGSSGSGSSSESEVGWQRKKREVSLARSETPILRMSILSYQSGLLSCSSHREVIVSMSCQWLRRKRRRTVS